MNSKNTTAAFLSSTYEFAVNFGYSEMNPEFSPAPAPVAAATGYPDSFCFARQFKRRTG